MKVKKLIKNLFSNRIIISILCLVTLWSCTTKKFTGIYEVADGYSDYYRNFLKLNKNGTYRLLFPSAESHHEDGIFESEGTWNLKNGEVLLTSYNQPKFYNLLDVKEEYLEEFDSVKFKFIVKNRFKDTIYKDIPLATLVSLRLSGHNDTTYYLNKHPKYTVEWNKENRDFFMIRDIFGFLAPYHIQNKKANNFTVYYSENDLKKLKKYDFFYKQPLKIIGDTLLYRNIFKFIKIRDLSATSIKNPNQR